MSPSTSNPPIRRAGDAHGDGHESFEAYEDDGGVVIYDAFNPLAWVESSESIPIQACR